MACDIDCTEPLTAALIKKIRDAGLRFTIQVDCSHAVHFPTFPQGQQANVTMAKAIELDTEIALNGNPLDPVMMALQNAPANSDLFRFYQCVKSLLSGLPQANKKVGFAHFDVTAVDLAAPDLAKAVTVCQTPTPLAFNALPASDRQRMGMYLRTDNAGHVSYAQVGGPSPLPRMA